MTNNGYRNLEGSPEYLTSVYWDKRITDTFGREVMAALFFARQDYFVGNASREEIAKNLPDTVLIHFFDFCDRVDAYDSEWVRKGKHYKKSYGSGRATNWNREIPARTPDVQPADLNSSLFDGKFRPPQTEMERQQFVQVVKSFADESGLKNFDAESFVHSLEVNGWKTVRGTVLVCWKQAAKKWHLHHSDHETDGSEEAVTEVAQDQEDAQMTATAPTEGRAIEPAMEDAEGLEGVCQERIGSESEEVEEPTVAAGSELSETQTEAAKLAAAKQDSAPVPQPMHQESSGSVKAHAIFDPIGCRVVGSDISCLDRCIQTAGGHISQRDFELLLGFTEKFSDDMIDRAADLANENALYNRIGYIRKTLTNWQKEGKFSLAARPVTQAHTHSRSYPQRPVPSPSAAEERALRSIQELQARYGSGDDQIPCEEIVSQVRPVSVDRAVL